MEKRKAISKRTRFEVFKRDGFKCQYCGSAPPQVILHVDHIKPVKEGGKNNVDNLITSCQPCNLGKGAVPLDRLPISLKEKAAAVKEMEAQIAGYAQVISQQQARIENEAWSVVDKLKNEEWATEINHQHFKSIKYFLERLAFPFVLEAAETAYRRFPVYGNRTFKYFCGVCWNKIREES